jgi:hypothetical protein
VGTLAARTEGWIAGLQMAAVSMRGQEDVSGFVQGFRGTNRYILDYLLEEVLQCQPRDPLRISPCQPPTWGMTTYPANGYTEVHVGLWEPTTAGSTRENRDLEQRRMS